MVGYIIRRLLLAAFTIWTITILSFVVIQLPEGDTVSKKLDSLMQNGDPVALDMADDLREYFGLNSPMHIRYLKWMSNMLRGDLGISYRFYCGGPREKLVKELIGERIQMTIVLTGFTILVTWTFAVPVGIYSAVRQHSVGDYFFTFIGFSGLAVPDFLLGLVLMYVAFAYFGQSVGGLISTEYQDAPWSVGKALDVLQHLWVPAVVLGTSGTASLIRIMRNNLLDELSKPYVVTARAKGMAPWRLIMKYPVRVAINPLVSTVGYLLPALVSGSVIVSVVLSLPTLGPVLLESMIQEDVYTAGFIVLMLGVLTIIGTLLSDILLAVVDPRIKYS
jgi:peptide/nickel transport system permease protein